MFKHVAGVGRVKMTPEEVTAWEAQQAIQPEHDTSYRLYKSTLIRRLTEEEATTLKALLAASPDKSQMLWAASEWLGSEDPLFKTLEEAIAGALGPDRASEILAEGD